MIAVPRIIVFSATRPLVIIRVIILVIKIIDKINTVIIADDEWWLPLLFSTLTPYNHHHKQIHHRHCHHHFTLYVTLIIHFYQFLLANDNNSSFWAFTSPIPNTELLQLAGFQIMIGNPGHQAFLTSVSITSPQGTVLTKVAELAILTNIGNTHNAGCSVLEIKTEFRHPVLNWWSICSLCIQCHLSPKWWCKSCQFFLLNFTRRLC